MAISISACYYIVRTNRNVLDLCARHVVAFFIPPIPKPPLDRLIAMMLSFPGYSAGLIWNIHSRP